MAQTDSVSTFGRNTTFALSIVLVNFLLGAYAPTLFALSNEVGLLDLLWRTVLGQRVGVDFHDPLGFGPYQLGAVLWHWLGPEHYVLRLSVTLFNMLIAFCGCLAVHTSLSRRKWLGWLFCVALAFYLSAPTSFENSPLALGMAGFYNRQIAGALAVLFLISFADDPGSKRDTVIRIMLIAVLLNVMFLIKISGLLLGVMILLSSCLLKNRGFRHLGHVFIAMAVAAGLAALEFHVTDLAIMPVIREYAEAANARLAYSIYDLVRALLTWQLVLSVTLLLLFGMSRPGTDPALNLRRTALIVGTYATCQLALNMTNMGSPGMWMATAAAATLAMTDEVTPMRKMTGQAPPGSRFFALVNEVSVRAAIPTIIFLIVLAPQIGGSIVAAGVNALLALKIEKPYSISAGRGVSFKTLSGPRHGPLSTDSAYNEAIQTLIALRLDRQVIANLDYMNPFPVLLLAPPPKGVYAWIDWGVNVPKDAVPSWRQVIGDACVVTVPAKPWDADVANRLREYMQPKLDADFRLVAQSSSWKIYRKTQACAPD